MGFGAIAGQIVGGIGGRKGLGMILDGIGIGGNAAQMFKDLTPKIEDEVTVEVIGQPGSTKRELYYLAMSAAYGLARPNSGIPVIGRFITPPPNLMLCEYDAADSWVRFTLKYQAGIFNFVANNALDTPVVIKGPEDELKGGRVSVPVPKLPPILPGLESLPGMNFFQPLLGTFNTRFTNKIILTSSGVAESSDPSGLGGTARVTAGNPRPTGDSLSRGSAQNPKESEVVANYLVPMVFSSLSDPGSQNQMFVPAPVPPPGYAGSQ